MTTPVNPDQLRISIEMGDEYQPSDRLSAALVELATTLAEEESDAEVAGFRLGNFEIQDFKALSYDSASPAGSKGSVFPKVETAYIDKSGFGVFTF